MMVQIPPRLERLPLGRGQKALLGVSAGVLVASALVLLHSDSAGEFRQPASGAETRGGFEGGVELSPDPTNPRDAPD